MSMNLGPDPAEDAFDLEFSWSPEGRVRLRDRLAPTSDYTQRWNEEQMRKLRLSGEPTSDTETAQQKTTVTAFRPLHVDNLDQFSGLPASCPTNTQSCPSRAPLRPLSTPNSLKDISDMGNFQLGPSRETQCPIARSLADNVENSFSCRESFEGQQSSPEFSMVFEKSLGFTRNREPSTQLSKSMRFMQ